MHSPISETPPTENLRLFSVPKHAKVLHSQDHFLNSECVNSKTTKYHTFTLKGRVFACNLDKRPFYLFHFFKILFCFRIHLNRLTL